MVSSHHEVVVVLIAFELDADWEVINQGPTQGKNSPKDVTPSPQYVLVPLECLQEVYKPLRNKSRRYFL